MIGGHRDWFHGRLKEKLAELMAERAASLARGAASDFADYRYGVGYLAGLQDAAELSDDILKEIDRA